MEGGRPPPDYPTLALFLFFLSIVLRDIADIVESKS